MTGGEKMDYRKLTDRQLEEIYDHWREEEHIVEVYNIIEFRKDLNDRWNIMRAVQEEMHRRSIYP